MIHTCKKRFQQSILKQLNSHYSIYFTFSLIFFHYIKGTRCILTHEQEYRAF
ncbi:hypothetical protein Hanom_Chr04g00297491 [Helianthus anomalus]